MNRALLNCVESIRTLILFFGRGRFFTCACVMAITPASTLWATALFLTLTHESVVVGVDSRISYFGRVPEDGRLATCKIFQVGKVFIAHSGRYYNFRESKLQSEFQDVLDRIPASSGVEATAKFLMEEFPKIMGTLSNGSNMNSTVFGIEDGKPVVARIVIPANMSIKPKLVMLPKQLNLERLAENQRMFLPMGSSSVYDEFSKMAVAEILSPEDEIRAHIAAEIGAAIERHKRGGILDIAAPIAILKVMADGSARWVQRGACSWDPVAPYRK